MGEGRGGAAPAESASPTPWPLLIPPGGASRPLPPTPTLTLSLTRSLTAFLTMELISPSGLQGPTHLPDRDAEAQRGPGMGPLVPSP